MTEKSIQTSLNLEEYIQNIVEIRRRIESGDIYQINYTTQFKAMLNRPEDFLKTLLAMSLMRVL